MAIVDMKPPKILFFHRGPMPSAKQYREAMEYGSGVQYRNADFVYPGDRAEECAGVAGEVPDNYKHLPTAADAITSHKAKLTALLGGDDEAPAPTGDETNDDGKTSAPNWNGGA